jgi:hypothetical protein
MYYQFIPNWKNNFLSRYEKSNLELFDGQFIGDDSIVHTKFRTLADGVEAMKLDGTCLREKNWTVLECSFFSRKRIMLKSLHDMGYFLPGLHRDDISEYYTHK